MEDQNALAVIRIGIEYKPTGREYNPMCRSRLLFKKGVYFYLLG
jgi:hypothetical protein